MKEEKGMKYRFVPFSRFIKLVDMKKILIVWIVWISVLPVWGQFDARFLDKTLRFDYIHGGDRQHEYFLFTELVEEPYWGGSKVSLIDDNGYGNLQFKLFDAETGELIYSRGYCTLFTEWQREDEATRISRGYPESLVFPFPKNKVRLEIYSRGRDGKMNKKYEQAIDPADYAIRKNRSVYPMFEVHYTGRSDQRVDIVLLSEGYSEGQRAKFEKDCAYFADELFRYSPFKENKHRFNIRGVWVPSEDEGITLPGEHVWRNTALGAKFYTFGSERYQMIDNFQRVRDVAASAPYDYIYVLSNTQKYGGGGIYNFYGIGATDHPDRTGKVHVHEFGHVLLGLGDEYVGGVESDEFYPLDVEPWEANLTTLKDFERKAWSKMVESGLPVPTPAIRENKKKVGVYEGGGYVSKGVYRPWMNCMMNNLHTIDEFCPVCKKAISDMIDFHCR